MQYYQSMNIDKCMKKDMLQVSLFFKHTAQNAVISPNLLVWKFCGKAQLSA